YVAIYRRHALDAPVLGVPRQTAVYFSDVLGYTLYQPVDEFIRLRPGFALLGIERVVERGDGVFDRLFAGVPLEQYLQRSLARSVTGRHLKPILRSCPAFRAIGAAGRPFRRRSWRRLF